MINTATHGNMIRDIRDGWPDNEPIGSFDIEQFEHGLLGYPGASAHLLFICPNNKRCSVLLGPSPVTRQHPDGLCIWGWDGNLDCPTLTPSINCIAEKYGNLTSGCGWHGFITKGVIK
jgi:hypothetical protein